MSFLGVLVSLFSLGSIAVDEIQNENKKIAAREKAERDGLPTYMDNNCREYFTKTGEEIFYFYENGEKVIKSLKTHKTLYNCDQEKKKSLNNELEKKAREKGKRFCFTSDGVFKEIETGRLYKREKYDWNKRSYKYYLVEHNKETGYYSYVSGKEYSIIEVSIEEDVGE